MPLLGGKNKAKAEPARIRIEKVVLPAKPKPRPLAAVSGASSSKTSRRPSPLVAARPQSLSPYPSSSDDRRSERKRKAGEGAPRKSPAVEIKFDKDSDVEDGDDDWVSALDARKRQRKALGNGRRIDMNRSLRNPKSFGEPERERELQMIHAIHVASLKDKCVPVLGASADEVAVELQYPSLSEPEQFELVYGKDQIDAVKQIIKVVRHVAEIYLTDEQAKPFTEPSNGLVRRLEKASNRNVQDLKAFKAALAEYNERILALVKDGTVGANLDKRHELPRSLVAFMLLQVYDRTVAPKVELLRQYENGTDNVYGELLHPFASDILVEKTKMTSDQVFMDLGSGVGNVVLQAALEIGCETWGCEMMDNACNLAEEQQKEFVARCKLWGVASGKVHLERGDFRKNERIHEALKRADVVLVNNQAFTSQLNDDLVRMFLDLKSGCKIVSLKTFVHDHKSASHNINDVGSTILDVEELTYPQGYVSWTGAGGTYYISTRK